MGGDLKARFTIQTPTGPEFLTSSLPIAREAWSLVTGKYDSGRIYVGVENALESMFVSGAPATVAGPIEIGAGLTGDLDEIRIFDLTKGALSTFGNGQQTLNFIADASGEFQAPIVATGAMSAPRVASYYRNLASGVRVASAHLSEGLLESLALQDPGASAESAIGIATIEAETYWNDTADSATTTIGFVSASTMAFFAKMGHAIIIGSGGAGDPPDLALVAGDLLGSIFLSPVTILRDVANSSERLIRGSANGQDGLDLALGVVNVGASLVKGKASALLKLGPFAKSITRTGRGSKTVARLIAVETSFAAGASGVSRIKKLVEVANLSATAAILVGALLDLVGDDDEAVGHLNNVLDESPNPPDKPTEILDTLHDMSQQVDAVDFKHVLAGIGATDDGNPAADAGTVPKGARATKKTLTGMTVLLRRTIAKKQGIRRGVAGSLASRASRQMHRAAGLTRTERKIVLEKLHTLLQHPRGVVGVERFLERLGKADTQSQVHTQLVHLDDALELARRHPTRTVGIEVEVEVLTDSVGGARQRRFDTIVTDEGKDELEAAVKAAKDAGRRGIDPSLIKAAKESASWQFFYQGGFPVLRKGRGAGRPIDGKLDQFLTEMSHYKSELIGKSEFAPRLPGNVDREAFVAKLRQYYKSKMTASHPIIRKHFRRPNENDKDVEKRLAPLRALVDEWVK